MASMDDKGSPYRVPILRLSDVYNESDRAEEQDAQKPNKLTQDDTPEATETRSEPTTTVQHATHDATAHAAIPAPAEPAASSSTPKPSTPKPDILELPNDGRLVRGASTPKKAPAATPQPPVQLRATDMRAAGIQQPTGETPRPTPSALNTAPFGEPMAQVSNLAPTQDETTLPATASHGTPPQDSATTEEMPQASPKVQETNAAPAAASTQKAPTASPPPAPAATPVKQQPATPRTIDDVGEDPLDIWDADALARTQATAAPKTPEKKEVPPPQTTETPATQARVVGVTPTTKTTKHEQKVRTTPSQAIAEHTPVTTRDMGPPATIPMEPGTSAAGAQASGVTLDALRNRVLHESMGKPLTPEAAPTATPGAVGAAKRKRELTRSDLTEVQSAHAMLGSDGEQDPATVPNTASAPTVPQTKHAQALAGVAQTLKSLTGDKTSVPHEQPADAPGETPEPALGTLDFTEAEHPTSTLPTIRTFRSDVEQAVTRNRTSVVDMIAAQEKKRSDTLERPKHSHHINRISLSSKILLVVSALLVLGGIVAGILYYMTQKNSQSGGIQGVFLTEASERYDSTTKDRAGIMSDLVALRDSIHHGIGSMTEIRMFKRVQNTKTNTEDAPVVTASEFLSRIHSHAPDNLVRSLSDKMVLGVYEGVTENVPFLVFRSNYYENTYAGMLDWEQDVQGDLAPLFGSRLEDRTPVTVAATTSAATATSTNSTTAPVSQSAHNGAARTFVDQRIANVPIRALRNADNKVVLLWSMPSNNTLIIASNTDTLSALLKRITARTY